jgi:hypothetical protein
MKVSIHGTEGRRYMLYEVRMQYGWMDSLSGKRNGVFVELW